MIYRREIDGLRAIAVIPVILFHAGMSPFSGGFVGVDVFFVISGYLITSILIDEIEQGSFSIVNFYERRARRILPALFFVMLCCIPFAWIWMLPDELKDFSQSLVAVVFFSSNVLFWMEDKYFAPSAELKPLLHTWSLAVEEQFYLFFPIFLLFAWRFGRQRAFWSICVIAALSLAASEWGWRNNLSANFYIAPTRAWELLAGSLCAFWRFDEEQRASNWLGLLGLAMIIYAIFAYDAATPFPSVYGLVPVVGTILIIVFGVAGTWSAKLLSMRALVSVGLISYSAYLWHQPLFAFARIQSIFEPSPLIMAALAMLSLVLAYFSWRYIEKPFRKTSTSVLPTRRAAFATSGAVAVVFVLVGVIGHNSKGFEHLWRSRQPQSILVAHRLYQYERQRSAIFSNDNRIDNGDCIFDIENLNPVSTERILLCSKKHGPGILIFGDSHATNLFNSVFTTNKGRYQFIVGITKNGCYLPFYSENNCDYKLIYNLLSERQDLFSVAIYETAGYFILEYGREIVSPSFINKLSTFKDFKYKQAIIDGTINYLADIAKQTHVVWFGPRLEPHITETTVLRNGCDYKYSLRPYQAYVYSNVDDKLKYRLKNSDIKYISQIDKYNFNINTDFINCNASYWIDGDHFSQSGEIQFAKRFDFIKYLGDIGFIR